MSQRFDVAAEDLAQTYASMSQLLSEAKEKLVKTTAGLELVCRMDPGLSRSLDGDMTTAALHLDVLIEAASQASTALHRYADVIRAGGA